MHNSLFLLDPTDELVNEALSLNPTSLFVNIHHLGRPCLTQVRDAGVHLYASVDMLSGEDLWEQFPGSQPVTADGSPLEADQGYTPTTPTNRDVYHNRVQQIRNALNTYAFDGLWLDSLRWPGRCPHPKIIDTGHDEKTLAQFRDETGVTEATGEAWHRWKVQKVVDVVAEIRDTIKAASDDILLGYFSLPWLQKEYDGAVVTVFGQDLAQLAEHLDVVSPMTYHAMCGKDTAWIASVVQEAAQLTNKPVLPLVQTENIPRDITTEEFAASLVEANKAPSEGSIIFFLDDLLKQPEKKEEVERLFTNV